MNIIAADDENGALSLLKEAIMEAIPEANLDCFSYGEDVIEAAGRKKTDIAFLDIQMGDMTGLSIAKVLKRINPQTNIIFVTGYASYLKNALSLHASGYLRKPIDAADIKREYNNLLYPIKDDEKSFFKTFGTFELFVNDKPVDFSRSKSKELLALLIDKQGEACSRKELISELFPGNDDIALANDNYFSKILRSLKDSLKEVGMEDILLLRRNQYSVNKEKIHADSYDYLKGEPWAINKFKGEYMLQYPWAASRIKQFYQ